MANIEKIKDEGLRMRLDEAHQQLRGGKPSDAVRTLVDAFLAMLEMKPSLLQETVPVRGRTMPLVMRWPALGADLSAESVREGKPRIDFTRDKFAMSEALTYYEFTVDTAIEQGL
jgi:hypothetical protein